MGYDSYVYLIYGIRISYTADDSDEAYRLMQLIVPDLIGKYSDDVWGCFDDDPHVNGYYCLNFTDQGTGESEIFIACWFHQHCVTSSGDDCKEVTLPSAEDMTRFQQWCVENGVEQPKFYTKTYESY